MSAPISLALLQNNSPFSRLALLYALEETDPDQGRLRIASK